MKANMKKLLAMGLTVVLTVGCLSGCGDDKMRKTKGLHSHKKRLLTTSVE